MIDGPAKSPGGTPADAAARVFVGHRDLLFSIVHQLLDDVSGTEEVLRETWLSWVRTSRRMAESIGDPRGYLVRIAVNRALARQAGASGGSVPVPDSLTPLERAVFILHEECGYRHSDIADMLGRRPRYPAAGLVYLTARQVTAHRSALALKGVGA